MKWNERSFYLCFAMLAVLLGSTWSGLRTAGQRHRSPQWRTVCYLSKHCAAFQVMNKNEQFVENAHFHAWHPMSVKSSHHQTDIMCPVLAFTDIFDLWLHQRNTDGGKVWPLENISVPPPGLWLTPRWCCSVVKPSVTTWSPTPFTAQLPPLLRLSPHRAYIKAA